MIAEAGTVDDLKNCVLGEICTHVYGCGHEFIYQLNDASNEFQSIWWCVRHKLCPDCSIGFANPLIKVLVNKETLECYDC